MMLIAELAQREGLSDWLAALAVEHGLLNRRTRGDCRVEWTTSAESVCHTIDI
jgi:hypothetical protein